MSEGPINLNRARKARDRAAEKARADENAARHGLTKAERVAEATRSARARALLDAHKFTEDE